MIFVREAGYLEDSDLREKRTVPVSASMTIAEYLELALAVVVNELANKAAINRAETA